jgi:hypothetical protein
MQHRTSRTVKHALDLPPPFQAIVLREVGDAFAHAQAVACEQGAGTLVYVGRFDLAEFAVVLEPDEPLARARRVFYAGMVALRDALSHLAPPERPITVVWPDAIGVDGGLVGGGRLAWPADAVESEPPAWMVFGVTIRMVAMGLEESGLRPLATALSGEGFEDGGADRLVESFARHLMFALDAWRTGEFSTITSAFLRDLEVPKGASASLDGNGDLLLRWRGQTEPDRRILAAALAEPSWLDPSTGGLRT